MRRAYERSLLCGVSLLALSLANGQGHARSLTPVAPTQAAQQAAIQAAQQAAGAANQAEISLARAAAALAAARKLQSDAAAAARAGASSVPNGLVTGGLMPAGGTNSDPLAGIKADASKWVGAAAPVQSTGGGKVSVDIQQSQQKSILYWDTFNVGANTTVNFKQSSSDWIALNRVQDPSASPSRILGQINALGGVYLINGNGVIFGAGSQVNVHTLIASSLDVGLLGSNLATRDQYFLNTGVANLNSFSIYDKNGGAATNLVAGDITVERGASIAANTTSDVVKLGSPGTVYLFGANVHNSGSITAPAGEVAMIAARTIDVVPNGYSTLPSGVLGKDDSGNSVQFRGTEFRISQFAAKYDTDGYPHVNTYLVGTGAVTHDGLVDASRGIVVMNGDTVAVDNPRDASGHSLTDGAGQPIQGVISVDTSIDRNSFVLLRAATSVSMNGVISSQPVDDGAAGLTSSQSFTPAYVEATAQTSVTVGSTGLISAPSAQVALGAHLIQHGGSVTGGNVPNLFNQGMTSTGAGNQDVASTSKAPQSVLLAPGATIDVAGLANIELPASYNVISFQPRAEFADMPLQRVGALYGQTMYIDIRSSGMRSDGTKWVGTPLADASGYVAKVPRSIYQLMTVGGSVSLSTDLSMNNGASSVTTDGSIVNVAGGSVKFLPGMINTTRLIGSDGRIYSMANADPNMTYVGIAGQFTLDHAHWGVKEIWSSANQIDAPGYTEGHDAGSVNVVTVDPSLLGRLYFGATAGERQISSGQLPLQGSLSLTTPSSVQIGAAASADYSTQSAYTTSLSDSILSGYGLSSLSVTANDFVLSSGSSLNLAAGGSLSVSAGGAIDIAGTVAAAGGSVALSTDRVSARKSFTGSLFNAPKDTTGNPIAADIFVEGTIDVSGRFVNDIGRVAGTDAAGPAFINGGTISMTTTKDSTSVRGGYLDATGSILLKQGSVLDVSSGAYISAQGKAKSAGTGVLAGRAGGISFQLYSGGIWNDVEGPHHPTANVASPAFIALDGTLRGYGFESNGRLRIAGADTIRIGGALQPGETSTIRIGGAASTLPSSLLTGGGFGAYTIESVMDDWSGATANVIVSAGSSLASQQQNLASAADYTAMPTGTKLGQQDTPQLALLPDDQRKPVNLTLLADNILLDTGSRITADPKTSITMAAVVGDRSTLKPTDPAWIVPAKSVELRGTIVDHGGSVFINSAATHLSPNAKIDVSGTFIANSLFGTTNGPRTSGAYISGGTFSVEAGQIGQVAGQTSYAYSPPAGYLVADVGALVDVSGAAGSIQVAGARGATTTQWSWSDAGAVSADVSGFAWGGSFAAAGGRYAAADGSVQSDSRANGGTILLGGGGMLLRQDTTDAVNALAAYHFGVAPGALVVAADQLAPFDNVYLYAGNAVGGAPLIFTDLPGNNYGITGSSSAVGGVGPAIAWSALTISGALNWNVTNRLHIAAGSINAPASGSVDATLSASYVSLAGRGSSPAAGTSTLTVNAKTIDLEGAPTPSGAKAGDAVQGLDFSGFSQVNLIASGDIRLSTLKVQDGLKNSSADKVATAERSSFTGNMVSAGDFLLLAERIYPVTAVSFTIETPGNVKFAAPADSNTSIPLSAGGGITVHAKSIDQAGNLLAPLGTITLGSTDSSVSTIITQSVVLESGSLTSVTLADTTVPYGATADGTNWYYNANLNALTQPPSKGLILSGSTVTRADGSTIDLRGGGDIQAMEWIQGKGGSRDTLTTTPSGQTVYALVPSQNDPIAAYDIHFATARSADNGNTITAGDAVPLPGQQITIDGGGGIPAGTYAIYPAHYATLPGAMRVVLYTSDTTGKNLPTGTTLPDGTVLVTGHATQSTVPGKQSSGQAVFAVQTNPIWQQYSEYKFNGANAYFTQTAAKQNKTAPRLPMDAGRLSVSALQTIVLNGMALTRPGTDSLGNIGRGGELDISAPKLAVLGHAAYEANDLPAGYVGLDVGQINGFESVLIGGSRSDFANGTLITPTASNVVVDTRGETLSAPEILLVARVGEWQQVKQAITVGSGPNNGVILDIPVYVPLDGSGTVSVQAGSIIETTGVVHAGAGRNYVMTSDNQAPVTAQSLAAALGGTLSGNEIVNVDLTKLPASWFTNGYKAAPVVTGKDNKSAITALTYYSNGGAEQPNRGALFAASNDTTLKLTGPTVTGAAIPALTIRFKDITTDDVKGTSLPTGQVAGSLTLPGGDSSAGGKVTIADGASVTTRALNLQGTAAKDAIVLNSSDLHASLVNLVAPSIGIGASGNAAGQSLILSGNPAQFAQVATLALRAFAGPITVYGNFNAGTGSLTLDANAIVLGQDGGAASDATITASNTIALTNTAGPAFSGGSTAGGNNLQLVAGKIELGNDPVNGVVPAAYMTIAGYSTVGMSASERVLIKGPGALVLGANKTDKVDLAITTPSVLVAGASGASSQSFSITGYAGNIAIRDNVARNDAIQRPVDSTEVGGSLQVTAANINVASTIQAQGGTITLSAIAGNLELENGAYLSAAGYRKTLVDVDTYAPGGKVVLNADVGTAFLPFTGEGKVKIEAGSVIDVAQAAGGFGYGGEIDVNAVRGSATIAGALRGAGAPGLGGRFKLDTLGSADLTSLADNLLAGGLTGAVDIHTRTGNLELAAGHSLKANSVTLTADDAAWDAGDATKQFGQVKIRGRIDATGYGGTTPDGTGQAGGQVGIYGANAVFLAASGVIDASTTHADERGGDVTIGIGWDAKSKIALQQGTQINVSGGSRGGLSGGTVTFRAPLDGNNDVRIAAISNVANGLGTHGANFYADGGTTFDELPVIDATNNVNDRSKISIVGARSVAVNGFIAFDTQTSKSGINGSSLGWFGTIDTAGWYKGVDQNGNLIPATDGSWTNVSGWQISGVTTFSGFATAIGGGNPNYSVAIPNGNGAVLKNFVMGIYRFTPNHDDSQALGYAPGQTNIPVTFDPPPAGGVTAQGFATATSDGSLAITITNLGSGYTSALTSVKIGTGGAIIGAGAQFGRVLSWLTIVSADVALGSGGASSTAKPSVNVAWGNGIAVVSFAQAFNLSGSSTQNANGTISFVGNTKDFIPWSSSGVFQPFAPADQGKPGVATFSGGAGTGHAFFGDTISAITKGTWSYNGQSYGFSNLFTRLAPLVGSLGADVVHVQPGIELVNSKGDITVGSNWNLAAGTAGNLQSAGGTTYFDPTSSYVNFTYRLATPWGGLDAGALSLRAAGNINVNASISDGFFQFGNYLDPRYISAVNSYLASNGSGQTIDPNGLGTYTYYLSGAGAVPVAPYNAAGNSISPTSQDLATADLFPHQLLACTFDCSPANVKLITAPSSWSYGFTAGADLTSANPEARVPLARAELGINNVSVPVGNITIDKHATYTSANALVQVQTAGTTTADVTYNIPTMVRTGTGSIDMSAARDVVLNDPVAPGVIYAAGVNTAKLPDPNYTLVTANGASSIVVGNNDPAAQQDLFLAPRVLAYGTDGLKFGMDLYAGPPSAAAFPERGGDVRIDAQRDIVGNTSSGDKVVQYYQPWLLSQAGVAGSASALFGAGVFAPSGTQIASQTAWWIQYSSFRQGILSAGGNVTVIAGHDMKDVSVSAPTTGRVSGGLSSSSTPVTHLNGSGNMVVRAGNNIVGGSFYEGSGHARITAEGSVGQYGNVLKFSSSAVKFSDIPLLAVDTGQIALSARGSIAIAGVVNPAELHAQQPSLANPLDPGANGRAQNAIYMDTYGPDSKVRLVAETGDLTISISPTAVTDRSVASELFAAASMYPASFEALALNGNISTTGLSTTDASGAQIPIPKADFPTPGIVLSPSEHGTFELMAQRSVDLSFGYPKNSSATYDTIPRPYISAGSSLIDTAFDPFQPNNGFTGSFSGAVLAHNDDVTLGIDATARIYAATGDVTGTGSYGKRTVSDPDPGYQHIEINRPIRVVAGHDVVDLNIIVQNIHASDVSSITAGNDIRYTGYNNGGGLQVAGPGFLVVQAGGDIGPFLPAAHDNSAEAPVQEGIVSVGNSTPTPVGNIYVNRQNGGSVGVYDTALLGPRNNPRRNAALPEAAGTKQGADIVAMFGTKFGVDYQAVVDAYVDPAKATGLDHNYVPELRAFLTRVGRPAIGDDANVFAAFEALPIDLQHVFLDQVFFAELKAVGIIQAAGASSNSQRGYRMIETMFPARLGYTENALGGASNGASQLVKTGDMNLLHATVQTKLGGDVSIFGPGGDLTVGSLAAEPNSALKLRDIGILTLGGGAINTFTDGNVLVNSSRVLTTQGGDILMWSSNGNLDAGRGSKTTLSAPALQVLYDQDDYQLIDLGGFVTGAGIGTLQASSAAGASELYLLAPRGTIDFGTAGVRASGNAVFVAPVIANASNFQVQGSTTGIPTVSVPNVGALTAGSNSAGAAAKTADTPTASGASKPASIWIVEVIGYGGGDGQDDGTTDKKESGAASGSGKQ